MRTRATITALAATGLLFTACGGGSASAGWTTGKDVLDALDANGFTCDPPSSGQQVSIDPEPTTGEDTITVTCDAGYRIVLVPTRDKLLTSLASSVPCEDLPTLLDTPEFGDPTLVLGDNYLIAAAGDISDPFPAVAQPADFTKAFGAEETTFGSLLSLACEQAGDTNADLTPNGAEASAAPEEFTEADIEAALRGTAVAMETYYTDNGDYPSPLDALNLPETALSVQLIAQDGGYCLTSRFEGARVSYSSATGAVADGGC